MKVLVTDGNNRAALAVTRSLGRAGYEVVVGESRTPSLAQSSRFCSRSVEYPDPTSASAEFVDSLSDVVRREAIDVLVPVSDITTFLVTQNRSRWPASCAIPFGDPAAVERAADKVDLVRTAERIGVAVPKSVVVEAARQLPDPMPAFPLVVKPWRSRIPAVNGWRSTSVSYATDLEALNRDLQSRADAEFPVMLQQRIVGPGMGVFAYYHRGKAVALFSHKRLRERPPWGGVSVLAESAPIDPVAADYAIRLLDEIGWEGVAMVEFKRDLSDGLPKLMEINGRFWGSLQLAIDSGVDFPALLVRGITGQAVAPQTSYRPGVRTRWFWGDVDSLLLTLFGGKRWPGNDRPARLKALAAFLTMRGRDLYYDNPKPGDLGPFLYESRQWMRQWTGSGNNGGTQGNVSAAAPRKRLPAARLQARVSSSLAESGLDASEWNALAAASDTCTIFQTHEWAQSWADTFADHRRPLRIVTVSSGSSVVGVAPLVADMRGHGEPVLRFLGDGRADYCDILGGRQRDEVAGAVLDAVAELPWSAIELHNVPAQSRTPDLVRKAAAHAGYFTLVDEQYVCPSLVIRDHEREVEAVLHKPSLRRRRRLLERSGRLEIRDVNSADEVASWLDAFFEQHITRWAQTSTPSLFVDPRNQAFYRTLTTRVAPQGWLLFSVITLNGHPVAFHYGFDFNDSITWYKPSFDIARSASSPGLVMVSHLIDVARERGRRELDFTLGAEAFKLRFANRQARTLQISVFRDRARYMIERSRRQVSSAVKSIKG